MITASVVTYHTPLNDFYRLIRCILDSSIDLVYIVDNSSNDSLRLHIPRDTRVVYIHSDNLGFGHGHNIALDLAFKLNPQYHVIINPDTYWKNGVIETLEQYMNSHQQCGLVMPQILYPNGEIQYLCKLLPTPIDLFVRRFIPFYRKKQNNKFELRFTGYNKEMEVPSLSGCFMFVRISTLKQIGVFDERYFMYAEDVDLCRRIGAVSKTIFLPETYIYHKYEKGSYKNLRLLKHHIISVIKYFNKWGWFFDKGRKTKNSLFLTKYKSQN